MNQKNKKIVIVTVGAIALSLIGYASFSINENSNEINDNSNQSELVFYCIKHGILTPPVSVM